MGALDRLMHSGRAENSSPGESDAVADAGIPVSAFPALIGTFIGDWLQRGMPDPWGLREQLLRVHFIPLLDRLGLPGRLVRRHQKRGGQQEQATASCSSHKRSLSGVFADNPRSHTALVLDDCRLQGVGQLSTKLFGEADKQRFVDQIPFGTVG